MDRIFLKVYSNLRGEVCSMELEEIIYYMLVSIEDLKADYSIEVIKAAAVLLRSQLMKEIKNSKYSAPSNKSIIVKDDIEKYADDKKRDLIKRALAQTQDIIAFNGDKSVDFYYTKCCGGGTANSEDILGYRINYLRKVLCRYCDQEYTEKLVSIKEFARKLNILDISHNEEMRGIIKDVERDATGRIISINFMGQRMNGENFANFFGVPSNRIYFIEDRIVLKTIGNGMGLGICLAGGDVLAKQGKNFKDIINYYYTGVEFETIDKISLKRRINGKKIIIDPGHGGDDYGNMRDNIYEKDVNLSIANHLEKKLKDIGGEIILTREDDRTISMGDRVWLINNERPEFFISIHQNSFVLPGVNGVEAYCYDKDDDAIELGEKIVENIADMLPVKNRGVRTGDYFILRECKISGVLVECMYLSGDKDRHKYKEENYSIIADAIFKGLCQFYDIEIV